MENNNNLHFKKNVELICIQILDFKSNQGDDIKGYKIHYLSEPTGDFKDNYIGGKHEESFINDVNYKDTLMPFIKNIKKLPCRVQLDLEVVSTDKPPRISKLII